MENRENMDKKIVKEEKAGDVVKKNNQYNIVYRHRVAKPKTLSELFNKDGSIVKDKDKISENSKNEINLNKRRNYYQKGDDLLDDDQYNPNIARSIKEKLKERKIQELKAQEEIKEEKHLQKDKKDKNEKDQKDVKSSRNQRNKQIEENTNTASNNRIKNIKSKENYKNNLNKDKNTFKKTTRPQNGKYETKFETNKKPIIDKEEQIESERKISRQKEKEKEKRFEEARVKQKSKRERYEEHKTSGAKKMMIASTRLGGDLLDIYDTEFKTRKVKKKKEKSEKVRVKLESITIPETIIVKDLAKELKITAGDVLKVLMNLGIITNLNESIDFDTAFIVAAEFGVNAIKKNVKTYEEILFDETDDNDEDLVKRAPIVVVMGHVDHGKTSLLDAIRKTNKINDEAGGITQHIGAYQVKYKNQSITFLDTPGHEAFISMRARGAKATDIAILVVAANDGVKPQTIEAINHAKAAEIPIIVAINKIDLPEANPQKVEQELMEYGLVSEKWGGDTIMVEISAKNQIGIDNLLEMLILQAEVLDLKANPKKQAKGIVLEARLDNAKGPIVSMLVNRGTLNVGDTIVVGSSIGRIRRMMNDKGQAVKEAGPSSSVEVMGLTSVPEAGEIFYEVDDEKTAKKLVEKRRQENLEKERGQNTSITLNDLFKKMEQENLKKLNIIVKADVKGSAEAIKLALEKLSTSEIVINVIHSGVGAINESDVNLAKVANAIIIAFNVRPDAIAKSLAEKEKIEIKMYSVIYQMLEDIKNAMIGMLDPDYEEEIIAHAEVRAVFKLSKAGIIAGVYVKDGKILRNAKIRVIRDNVVLCDSKIASLKREKDDVKEVGTGFECGIQIENFSDIKENDQLEIYVVNEVKRKSLEKVEKANSTKENPNE